MLHDNLGIEGVDFDPFPKESDTLALNALSSSLQPYCIAVEIGTREGYSASIVARNIKKVRGHLYVVDLWGEHSPYFDVFLKNMELMELQDIVHPLAMKSLDASRIFQNGIVDFIFIDGNHSYESVKADIEAWLPKMKPDGVMSGHDYKGGGVTRAVDEMFGDKVIISPDSWVWHINKRMTY